MAENGATPGVAPGDRCAIGISFGNSYSSIACTIDDSPVVIANEDGGKLLAFRFFFLFPPVFYALAVDPEVLLASTANNPVAQTVRSLQFSLT